MQATLDLEYGQESISLSVSFRTRLLAKIAKRLEIQGGIDDYKGRRSTILQYLVHQGLARLAEQQAKVAQTNGMAVLSDIEAKHSF